MKLQITLTTLLIIFGASTVQAMPGHMALDAQNANQNVNGYVHDIASRKMKRTRTARRAKRRGGSGFASNGGPVKDTCTSSNPFYGGDCSPKKLTSRCDAAGGGMSSEPGGGVTCDTSGWD